MSYGGSDAFPDFLAGGGKDDGLHGRVRRHIKRAQRAFQGWRYLKADAAPPDVAKHGKIFVDPDMPKAMKMELAKLGLL